MSENIAESFATGLIQGQGIVANFEKMKTDALVRRKLMLEMEYAPLKLAADLRRMEAETKSEELQYRLLSEFGVDKARHDLNLATAKIETERNMQQKQLAELRELQRREGQQAEALPVVADITSRLVGRSLGGQAIETLKVFDQHGTSANPYVQQELGRASESLRKLTIRRTTTVVENGLPSTKDIEVPLMSVIAESLQPGREKHIEKELLLAGVTVPEFQQLRTLFAPRMGIDPATLSAPSDSLSILRDELARNQAGKPAPAPSVQLRGEELPVEEAKLFEDPEVIDQSVRGQDTRKGGAFYETMRRPLMDETGQISELLSSRKKLAGRLSGVAQIPAAGKKAEKILSIYRETLEVFDDRVTRGFAKTGEAKLPGGGVANSPEQLRQLAVLQAIATRKGGVTPAHAQLLQDAARQQRPPSWEEIRAAVGEEEEFKLLDAALSLP
jgi:hypothetical protein